MIISTSIAFVLCVILIPLIIKICNRFEIYDKVNVRKIHSGNIPRLGGLGVIVSFLVGITVYVVFFMQHNQKFAFPFIIAGLIIFIMGIVDDFHSLRARTKLIIQCLAALIIVLSGYRFKLFFGFEVPAHVAMVISFCWIVCIINAYNLIDGLDCLCGGLSLLTLGSLAIVFARSSIPAAAFCLILCGSIAGFLVYNKPKAKIFLGDGGSQFLGFVVAACPLFYSTPNYEYNKVLIMLVLVSIPMLDTIAAVWRRTREHRSFFSPDRGHIHHKLINIGFTKVSALLFLLSLQTLICLAVGFAMYLQTKFGTILLCITYAFVILFFSVLHYINRAVNLRLSGNLAENPNDE